jgi:hypothetical protein
MLSSKLHCNICCPITVITIFGPLDNNDIGQPKGKLPGFNQSCQDLPDGFG